MAYEFECNMILKGLLNNKLEKGNKNGFEKFMIGFHAIAALNTEGYKDYRWETTIADVCLSVLKSDKYIEEYIEGHDKKMIRLTDEGVAFIVKGGYTEPSFEDDDTIIDYDENNDHHKVLMTLYENKNIVDKYYSARQLYSKVEYFNRRWRLKDFCIYLDEIDQNDRNQPTVVVGIKENKHTIIPRRHLDSIENNGLKKYRLSQIMKERFERYESHLQNQSSFPNTTNNTITNRVTISNKLWRIASKIGGFLFDNFVKILVGLIIAYLALRLGFKK